MTEAAGSYRELLRLAPARRLVYALTAACLAFGAAPLGVLLTAAARDRVVPGRRLVVAAFGLTVGSVGAVPRTARRPARHAAVAADHVDRVRGRAPRLDAVALASGPAWPLALIAGIAGISAPPLVASAARSGRARSTPSLVRRGYAITSLISDVGQVAGPACSRGCCSRSRSGRRSDLRRRDDPLGRADRHRLGRAGNARAAAADAEAPREPRVRRAARRLDPARRRLGLVQVGVPTLAGEWDSDWLAGPLLAAFALGSVAGALWFGEPPLAAPRARALPDRGPRVRRAARPGRPGDRGRAVSRRCSSSRASPSAPPRCRPSRGSTCSRRAAAPRRSPGSRPPRPAGWSVGTARRGPARHQRRGLVAVPARLRAPRRTGRLRAAPLPAARALLTDRAIELLLAVRALGCSRMASRFDAIGFGVGRERAPELLGAAVERATDAGNVVEHADGRTLHYVDASGATLALHFDRDGDFACGQPGFAGETAFRWKPLNLVPDPDGCRSCDLVQGELLDADDALYYPFLLTIETLGATRSLIPFGEAGDVRFAGLWEEGEVWGGRDLVPKRSGGEVGRRRPVSPPDGGRRSPGDPRVRVAIGDPRGAVHVRRGRRRQLARPRSRRREVDRRPAQRSRRRAVPSREARDPGRSLRHLRRPCESPSATICSPRARSPAECSGSWAVR